MHRVTRVILHIDDIKFWVCFVVYQDKTYVLISTTDSTQPDETACKPGREDVGEGVAAGPPVDPRVLVQVSGARPGPPEHEGQRSSLIPGGRWLES